MAAAAALTSLAAESSLASLAAAALASLTPSARNELFKS
jgi:hypothetical protein